jgi:hypothetical protein
MRSDYTDANCRFHFGQLPDGRWFGLSCPCPKGGRTPLVLATSNDGVVFDHHYILGDAPVLQPAIPGHHKYGRYGYPSYHFMGDVLMVIYSVNKEDIACTSVPLDRLQP